MIRFAGIFFLFVMFCSDQVRAASASGKATQKVVGNLTIANVSDLDFGTGSPGDPEKTVLPDVSDTAENASFLVKGEANTSYRIQLPPDNAVKLRRTNGQGNGQSIKVHSFQSFPSRSGMLDAQGEQMLYVGATREALKDNLPSGIYQGSFTVTVIY